MARLQVDVIDWHFFEFFDYQLVLKNTNRIEMFLTMFSDKKIYMHLSPWLAMYIVVQEGQGRYTLLGW